jgi:5-methylcytosine-specific restriction endonuclease McrA
MALTTRCLDCGCRTKGSRCVTCQHRRDEARNRTPAQQARLGISREQRHRIYRRDNYQCRNCGRRHDLTIDHVMPLARNVRPTYTDDELVTLCRSCNSRKGG